VTVVTLLTDFGVVDTYVSQVKAAILAVAPNAVLVDLTHAVPPQDVQAGAFLLWSAVEAFAPGTVHLAVVDPGVGSPRRGIALKTGRGDLLVGPDNGLLLPAAERLGGIDLAVHLNQPEYWRPNPSSTFHGRDLFGPVAGHLAGGVAIERLGPTIVDLVDEARWPQPSGLSGEVIHVDTYGNLVTNLPAVTLPPRFHVLIGGRLVNQATHYQAVPPGQLVALMGSAGLLEISARDDSAARLCGAARGTTVTVES
jgi:S-adenosylmethionine hydrolase